MHTRMGQATAVLLALTAALADGGAQFAPCRSCGLHEHARHDVLAASPSTGLAWPAGAGVILTCCR